MDWPSGLGGVGGRGRASTHGAFSWVGGCKSSVLNPTKIIDFEFFWGPWSGATEEGVGGGGGGEVEGSGGVQGSGARGECRACRGQGRGGEGAVEGKHARSVFVGCRLQIVGSEPDKKTDFEFVWGRDGGVPGRATEEGVWGGGGRGLRGREWQRG